MKKCFTELVMNWMQDSIMKTITIYFFHSDLLGTFFFIREIKWSSLKNLYLSASAEVMIKNTQQK